ncbi:hypothetical protein HPP92_022207 [Vanilla planifolia]|uniref:ABC-2 type transporter transmembrane domain-containing protein n=1 Tax=Vanilla planifolia TaxID=51239 RepID=A0A835PR23_VANPL|nr:hypothetical protein HPP92_022207 [Vanilla planifolia]
MYSAAYGLLDKMERKKRALVEGIIVDMGLQECADTVIGNWHLRGIRAAKREGCLQHVIYFTTILERSIKRWKDRYSSIHQLSSEVFAQGIPRPSLRNPSDHFLRCINSDFDKVKASLKGSMKRRKVTAAEATGRLIRFYRRSQHYYSAREEEEISRVVNLCPRSLCFSFLASSRLCLSGDQLPCRRHEGFPKRGLNGHYGVTTFVISNTISAMPFLILISFLSGTVCYFMVRLHPGFMHYMFFCCAIRKRHCGGELHDGHSQFGSQLSYGYHPRAGIQAPKDIPANMECNVVYQLPLLGAADRREALKWCDLAVLFSMIAVYRVVFFAMIKISEEVTPWMSGSIARRRLMQKQRFRASCSSKSGLHR